MTKEELADFVAQKTLEAYRKGRAEADEERAEQWLPPMDPRLIAKAKALEYISLAEIKAATTVGPKRKKVEFELPCKGEHGEEKVRFVLGDDEQNSLKWLEWIRLFADLIDLYCNLGGHMEKLPEMLTHYRLLQRFGTDRTFTYESLITYDEHIRSRPEGQGPNLTWRFNSTTKAVYLKEYSKQTPAKRKLVKPKHGEVTSKKVCFDWAQDKNCKWGEGCKYQHACVACGVEKPQHHDLDKCPNKDKLKPKVTKKSRG